MEIVLESLTYSVDLDDDHRNIQEFIAMIHDKLASDVKIKNRSMEHPFVNIEATRNQH